jgi:Fe-S-cluster-containing hydrogenase component 2
MRLYVDNSKCSGCNACRVACSLNLFGENNPKKAALVIEPQFPAPGVYNVRVCTQCGDCAAVCPTEAIKQDEKGAYYVDFAECNLCGDCVAVCGTSALWIAEKEAVAA